MKDHYHTADIHDAATKDQIRHWWEVDGLSSTEIAQRLKCTKGAVTGKVRRMKLKPHGASTLESRRRAVDWKQVAALRIKGVEWHKIAATIGLDTATLRKRRDIYLVQGGFLPSPATNQPRVRWPQQVIQEPPARAPVPSAVRRGTRPLSDACQWPLSDGKPWRFCDDPAVAPGTPFCATHAALAYQAGRPLTVNSLGSAARG